MKKDAAKVGTLKKDTLKPDTLKADGPAGCGAITQVGCCKGNVLYWCDNNVLKILDCAPEPCGWDTDILEVSLRYHGAWPARAPPGLPLSLRPPG